MRYHELMEGGPGFGQRSHGGFGKVVFGPRHINYIADGVGQIDDAMVRQHLTQWLSGVFKLDNPKFNPEAFVEAVNRSAEGGRYRSSGTASFQSRHFYFLAHEIAEIPDVHERQFVCDWMAEIVGSTNQYFNEERWRKYCNLSEEDWSRQDVAHKRAKAKGDPNPPETGWQKRSRLEREEAEVVTPEELHQVIICSGEQQAAQAGHELIYLRKKNGIYTIWDKTANHELICIERD